MFVIMRYSPMVERLAVNQEVVGSSPTISVIPLLWLVGNTNELQQWRLKNNPEKRSRH